MGLYERLVEEASKEEGTPGYKDITCTYGRVWSLLAPCAGGYVTVEDLEREYERLPREQRRIQEDKEKRSKEIRVLRAFAHHGVHSSVQGMAYKSLQRKYPADWNRIRWERRTRG